VRQLVQSSLQPSSLPTYKRSWHLFYQFFHTTFPGVTIQLPISPPDLALFIAYLFDRNYAASTVNTYISAISYSHKLFGVLDPSKTFFIVQMLKGYGKLDSSLDCRLPITIQILHKILISASKFIASPYELCLFQAMCSLAFYAFLRVGEMTVGNKHASNTNLTLCNVTKLVNASNETVSLKVTFLTFKHSYNRTPFSLIITRQDTLCPVQLILDYLALRGNAPGALFIKSGFPITRKYFCDLLALAIKQCGLNPARYKGHSFRIGAASHAAGRGMSDAQIRVLGRWKSNAFLKYIRIPTMSA